VAGTVIAGASNLTNNLPMALVAASLGAVRAVAALHASLLIGVDLGPNLSVTGSLATLLWLIALRRENVRIDALKFFRIGLQVMPPALLAALAVAAFVHPL
jgi:arsenical pump membrane protein